MITSPRINSGVVTPSHGLFLTCRGEKCIQYCTIMYSVYGIYMCGSQMQKNPSFGDGLQWRMA
jgi:hypothetical protein